MSDMREPLEGTQSTQSGIHVRSGGIYGKDALGKIFMSHSSVDKAWVRKFDRRLRAKGYDTWLDEKEMDVGDALAAAIAEAVRDAKIVVVVVSAASLASRWLRYELDIATQRMIDGHCRLLPVLIDDVDVPAELTGRLYADMRPNRRGGFARLLRTLESEATKYPEPATPPTMDSKESWTRRQAYEHYLGSLADGGWFYGSVEISATRDINFEGIEIDDREVYVDIISIYSQREELNERDYQDWTTQIRDLNGTCGLLITEKRPSDALVDLLGIEDRVGGQPTSDIFQPSGALVIADLSGDMTESHRRDTLRRAFDRLKDAVESATPPLIDPRTLPRGQ